MSNFIANQCKITIKMKDPKDICYYSKYFN